MRVEGLLVCVSQLTKSPDIFKYARKIGIPLVFFDMAIKNIGFSYVVFDDNRGTTDAINQVINKGYKKIAHFAGYGNINIGKERRNSYQAALKRNKIPAKKEWIIEGGYEIEDGYKAFERLYSTKNLPEVILAVNDRVALGAYRAINKIGLKIPDDISIIGYGFSETAQLYNPTLSIINQDPRKMGRISANLLIDEILGVSTKSPSEILIDENFLWNNSISKKK
jgi:LacI family transcriptional regulator